MVTKPIEPVKAVSATAEELLAPQEKVDVDTKKTYFGADGDRLFTRDEVGIILKKRLDRYVNSILAKTSCTSISELVSFANYYQALIKAEKTRFNRSRLLKAEFNRNDKNIIIYTIYHNLNVNAVINPDGSLQYSTELSTGKKTALFFTSGDDIFENVITKTMTMSDFFLKVIDEGFEYFDLANSTDSRSSTMHVDTYKYFVKSSLDKMLNDNPSYINKYLFLQEPSIFSINEEDRSVLSLSLAKKLFIK